MNVAITTGTKYVNRRYLQSKTASQDHSVIWLGQSIIHQLTSKVEYFKVFLLLQDHAQGWLPTLIC